MKESNWPYLAGLIDGEGCFAIWRHNNKGYNGKKPYTQFNCRLSITNTSLTLMKWLIEHFGGVYYCKRSNSDNHWKASYEWRPKGSGNAKRTILAVLPYLVIKRDQAKVILEYISLPIHDIAGREELYKRLRLLNQKGSPPETNTSDISTNLIEMKIESDLIGDDERAPVVKRVA